MVNKFKFAFLPHGIYRDRHCEFGKVAGPKLNIAKTEGIWVGPLKSMSKLYADISLRDGKGAVNC